MILPNKTIVGPVGVFLYYFPLKIDCVYVLMQGTVKINCLWDLTLPILR